MERTYQGYDESKGVWEQFGWSEREEPTPENTGYDKVEKIDGESKIEEELTK